MTIVIVPVQTKTTELVAIPICGEFVVIRERCQEMASILGIEKFNSEVVNTETEADIASLVSPETNSVRNGFVIVFCEVGY